MFKVMLRAALLFILLAPRLANGQDPSHPESVAQRRDPQPLKHRFGRDMAEPVKLVVTAFEELEQGLFMESSRSGVLLSESGLVGGFYHGPRGSKGGGYPQLPEERLKRIDELLATLPPSVTVLPEIDRRLLIQVRAGERFAPHLYDRANLPDDVLELLRVIGGGIRSWVPEFKSDPVVKLEAVNSLAVAPNGKQFVVASYGTLKSYDVQTRRLIKEQELLKTYGLHRLLYTPDGKRLLAMTDEDVHILEAETWEEVKVLTDALPWHREPSIFPYFTSDGMWFVAGFGKDGAFRIFDTERWRKRGDMPGLPAHVQGDYLPASKSNRALMVPERFSLALYNGDEGREIARLERDAILMLAAFSPDESQVATVTQPSARLGKSGGYEIRVWDASSGKLVQTLRPYEQTVCEVVEWIGWTPDGRHLLAAAKAHNFWSSRDICVWDVAAGRQRGAFTGPATNVVGVGLTPDGRQLIAGVEHSGVYFWDFAAAMKTIEQHVASFRGEQEKAR